MKTKTPKKLKKTGKSKHKNRERVRKAVESVRGGARCLWRIGFEKKKNLEIGMKE